LIAARHAPPRGGDLGPRGGRAPATSPGGSTSRWVIPRPSRSGSSRAAPARTWRSPTGTHPESSLAGRGVGQPEAVSSGDRRRSSTSPTPL